ncbi:2,3-bisphosphoglycerate-dependent phosphoglycerate mutase [Aeromicrobium wangtongii]|uniref:2,3-bisphosphoglycerate-dependent phosphoglycerate mutase n=1 Tax=Aeromicrobium wangtongii TaxID=2969247 RepID=UPI002017A2E2|nr:2,3-bisphosphoglycerate-dependent phosphoglycerate mutase [Aeromicrobium wangtongii]MCL3817669.1 2,3-bisphosphoglycerate-dependent phosphoglycerate mutase [Aeromicrobium wangtongii]
MRHGATAASELDAFCGWLDPPLLQSGRRAARRVGRLLIAHGLVPQAVFCSTLTRSSQTAEAIVAEVLDGAVPIHRDWRLNERHYGALQGRSKDQVRDEVGADQLRVWRRTWDGVPPECSESEQTALLASPPFANLKEPLPRAESLAMVAERVAPSWRTIVETTPASGSTLVVGHSTSLRAMIALAEQRIPGEAGDLEIPLTTPILVEFRGPGRLGQLRYLDPVTDDDQGTL